MQRSFIGLLGIILAAISAEFNDQVATVARADVAGGLDLSHDAGTWFDSLYVTASILGMAVSPFLFVTFSIRQFALFVLLLNAVSSAVIPFCPDTAGLYALRIAQGCSGGLTIPMLMTVALRVLAPEIRLYGLAVYSLSATFAPAMATPMAALWTDMVGWQFVFLESIPLCALAAVMVWWGLPQDAPDYARFKRFDWRGFRLALAGFGALSTLLQQGDRWDWFASPTMCVLALVSVVALPLFLLNEWSAELPLMRLQLLGRRNIAYGLIAIFTFLIISQSGGALPDAFLAQVQGFRPEQLFPLTLIVGLLQIPLLPATAWLLDRPSVDPRFVSFVGLLLILAACLNNSLISSDWYPSALIASQIMEAVGQPFVIMPLLMMATNAVKSPDEAPFASSLVNTPRALSEAVAVWLTQLIQRWRGGLHYNRLADQLGLERLQLLPVAGSPAPGSLAPVGDALQAQATVLTLSDTYLIYGGITVALIVVLLLLPEHTLPPRLQLTQH